jgi:hypothetical protein
MKKMKNEDKVKILQGVVDVLLAEMTWRGTRALEDFEVFNGSVNKLQSMLEEVDDFDTAAALEDADYVPAVHNIVVELKERL